MIEPWRGMAGGRKRALTNKRKGQSEQLGLAVGCQDCNRLLLHLVQGSQAARAEAQSLRLAVLDYGHLLDVRFPAAPGAHLGVANVVPKSGRFAAQITFGHDYTSHIDRASKYDRWLDLRIRGSYLTTSREFVQTGQCLMQKSQARKDNG
jgi:hypothetical protein